LVVVDLQELHKELQELLVVVEQTVFLVLSLPLQVVVVVVLQQQLMDYLVDLEVVRVRVKVLVQYLLLEQEIVHQHLHHKEVVVEQHSQRAHLQ
jgi:hypothetical protein